MISNKLFTQTFVKKYPQFTKRRENIGIVFNGVTLKSDYITIKPIQNEYSKKYYQ